MTLEFRPLTFLLTLLPQPINYKRKKLQISAQEFQGARAAPSVFIHVSKLFKISMNGGALRHQWSISLFVSNGKNGEGEEEEEKSRILSFQFLIGTIVLLNIAQA